MWKPLVQQTTQNPPAAQAVTPLAEGQGQRSFPVWASSPAGWDQGVAQQGAATYSYYKYSSSSPNLARFLSITLILKMCFCARFLPAEAAAQEIN